LFSGYKANEWPDNHRYPLVLTEKENVLGGKVVQAELNAELMEMQYE